MTLLDLLGRAIDDPEVVGLLKRYGTEVVHESDPLEEGIPDAYCAEAPDAGFALTFNQDRLLTTIHCYVSDRDGYLPVSEAFAGVPFHRSFDEALSKASTARGSPISSRSVHAFNRTVDWVRQSFVDHCRHYEFESGALAMVTLMTRDVAP